MSGLLDNLRVLTRGKLLRGPIHVAMGDTISLHYTDRNGDLKTVLEHPVTRSGTYNEGVIFEGEIGGRHAIGGAFIEEAKA